MNTWSSVATVGLAAVFLACVGCSGSGCGHVTDPRSVVLPYEWEGDILQEHLTEPSGLTFHPGRGTLFLVGDEGDIAELDTDGKVLRRASLRAGADLEGITCVPGSGLLYAVIEGEEKILEVNPETLSVTREFALPRSVGETELFKPGGNGVEAICFVPDSGTFFVANQSFTLEPGEEPSVIVQIELPLAAPDADRPVRILNWFYPNIIDISALWYDASAGQLLAVSDTNNLLIRFTFRGKPVRTYTITGRDQEGLAIDPDGMMYIAQDSGGLIKIRPLWPE